MQTTSYDNTLNEAKHKHQASKGQNALGLGLPPAREVLTTKSTLRRFAVRSEAIMFALLKQARALTKAALRSAVLMSQLRHSSMERQHQ